MAEKPARSTLLFSAEFASPTGRCSLLQIIQGNVNTYMTELREIDPPLIARRVRFVPYSAHPKHICMRVELYGCIWTGEKPSCLRQKLPVPLYLVNRYDR